MNSVTVIIPAYNAEVCLQRCLMSVFDQEYPPEQVIVVNDGSTDNTKKIVDGYANRIEYFEQENQGPGASRNTGLKAARGAYVAFLDADDYWLPAFLSKCVRFLEKHLDAVAVSTGQVHRLWGHGEVILPPLLQNLNCPKEAVIIENFFSFWAQQNHIVTGSSLIRRRIMETAGYQRTDFRMCEDLEYWGYLATFGKWGFIPEVLWIGDPMPAAASHGWIKRHEKRWHNLPNIDDWQSRIRPRLKREDIEGFEKVKERVALSLVHQNILAGNLRKAKAIFLVLDREHSHSMIFRILEFANRFGSLGWYAACQLIQVRERLKAMGISLSNIHQPHAKVK